jgi:hypothetical protein
MAGQPQTLGDTIEDVFELIVAFAGHPISGLAYDFFIKTPQDQARFEQFAQDQGASTDFLNEMRARAGLPQLALEGSEFGIATSNLEFHQGELAKLDPSDPSQAGAIAAEEAEIAKAEAALATDGGLIGEVRDIGAEGVDTARDFFEGTAAQLDELTGETKASLLANTAKFNAQSARTQRGFEDILDRAQGLVEGLGDQEREDINTRADASASAQQAALAARGLGGTTVTSSQDILSEESRSDQLGRLNERLVREQLGVEATFGLAGLGFQERTGQFGANLGLGTTALQQQGDQFSINALSDAQNTFLDQFLQFGTLGADFEAFLMQGPLGQAPNLVPPGVSPGPTVPSFSTQRDL